MPLRAPGQSRVARRIVVLFVLCALVPVICLAVVASMQVTGELSEASRQRLHRTAKSLGIEILDQLRRVESDLILIDETMGVGGAVSPLDVPTLRERLAERFTTLAVISPDGAVRQLLGSHPVTVVPTAAEAAHMRTGKTVLRVSDGDADSPRLVMMRRVGAGESRPLLTAQIDVPFILNPDSVPPETEVHVLGPSLAPLFTAPTTPPLTLGDDAAQAIAASATGEAEWSHEGETYSARYWTLPLAFWFLAPDWKIVASEARTDMLAPIRSSRLTFILVTMLSLWVVTFFALSQVRRSMVPLARLREGTQRLGRGDFDGRVEIRSGDEFEELAASFNTMAGQLKRQFETLSAMAELDRAVLTSLDADTIVRGALERLPRLIGCDFMAIVVLGPPPADLGRAFVTATHETAPPHEIPCAIAARARASLAQESVVSMTFEGGVAEYLASVVTPAWATCVVFPLVFGDRLVGLLAIGDRRRTERSAEDLQHAKRLAAQVGVALSNADLVRALDRLNVGTLSALARAVDAKSPWTAGHSQRVTEMSVEIGRTMGLNARALDALARGGLLHDIGKIAVPTSLLNKPGPLTAEEFALMKEHPRTGARILEPIPEYGHLIPIVLQHHEWFDGNGYPFGLAGEAIDQGARILAVADVYDALTSKRPYREALSHEQAVSIIANHRGTQFEPRVVDAFFDMLELVGVHRRRHNPTPADAAVLATVASRLAMD
jgi:putative nucleotidyltransferase with HDIG domain